MTRHKDFSFAPMLFGILLIAGLTALVLAPAGAYAHDQVMPEIPNIKAWQASPHAKRSAEAFRHWDKEGKVPERCAKCHSTPGFLDFLGADGSLPGSVESPAPTDTVIECVACHNAAAATSYTVVFPSGSIVSDAGSNYVCLQCHQGQNSMYTVLKEIKGMALDAPSDEIKFINIHYRAAAATLHGTIVRGAYEYDGYSYAGKFRHIGKLDTCVECHDPHTTKPDEGYCAECHVETYRGLEKIRHSRSKLDFDGDGDITEGIAGEVKTLHAALLNAIQAYAKKTVGKPIGYDTHTYPYFFNDSNANDKIDADEAKLQNQYNSWTPRLIKAAYNYQFVAKDTGAYAHNGRYILQVLYDSLGDLNATTGAMRRPL